MFCDNGFLTAISHRLRYEIGLEIHFTNISMLVSLWIIYPSVVMLEINNAIRNPFQSMLVSLCIIYPSVVMLEINNAIRNPFQSMLVSLCIIYPSVVMLEINNAIRNPFQSMLVSLWTIYPSVVMLEINNVIRNPFQQNISTIVCLNHACCLTTDIITCKDQRQNFYKSSIKEYLLTKVSKMCIPQCKKKSYFVLKS